MTRTYWGVDEATLARIAELNSCGTIDRGLIRGVVDWKGRPYACTGSLHQGGSTLQVELHPLVPRERWQEPTFTYNQKLSQRDPSKYAMTYRGIEVRCRGKRYVLGKEAGRVRLSLARAPRPVYTPKRAPTKVGPEEETMKPKQSNLVNIIQKGFVGVVYDPRNPKYADLHLNLGVTEESVSRLTPADLRELQGSLSGIIQSPSFVAWERMLTSKKRPLPVAKAKAEGSTKGATTTTPKAKAAMA